MVRQLRIDFSLLSVKILTTVMNYYPYFLIIFVLILSLPLIMILTSKIVRFIAGYTNQTSDSIYECGEPRVENSWTKIPIGYFKVALIFILFDIELVFVFPWILSLSNPSPEIYLSFITFIVILFLGWIYAYKKGFLKWEM